MKDCQAITTMKLLIVLGLLSLSPSPLSAQIITNLARTTRTMADSMISNLRDIASDYSGSRAIDRIFNNRNTCFRNIDEVIEAIRESTRLVEDASNDFESLNHEVGILLEVHGEAEVVRQVADILRSLHPLLEKLSPVIPASRACSTSPHKVEDYFHNLALLLNDLSYDQNLSPTQDIQNTLTRSANIVSSIAAFIGQLRVFQLELQNFCQPSKESTVSGLKALGGMIDSLADMFSSLEIDTEIRKGKLITESIVDQIQAIEDFNGDTFDCSATDLQSAASTLEDLAKLIKELGMERIRSYLGVDIGLEKIIRKWKYKSNSGITKQLSYIKKTGHNSNILQDYYKNKRNHKTRKIEHSIQQNSNLGDIVKKYKTQSNHNPNVNYSFGKGNNLQDFSFGNSKPYIEKTEQNSNILQDYYKNKRKPNIRTNGHSNLGDIVKKYKTQSNHNPNVKYNFGKDNNLQDFSFGNSQLYIEETGHNSNILQDYYKNKRKPNIRTNGHSIQQNSNLGDIVKKYKTQSNYNPNVNYRFGKGYNLQDFSFGNSQPYIEKNNYSNYGKAPQRQRSDISQRYKAHFNIGINGSDRRPSFKTVLKGKAWKLKNIYGPRRNTGLWASASYF